MSAEHLQFCVPRVEGDQDPYWAEEITIKASRRHWVAISAMIGGLCRMNLTPELNEAAGTLERELDRITGIADRGRRPKP